MVSFIIDEVLHCFNFCFDFALCMRNRLSRYRILIFPFLHEYKHPTLILHRYFPDNKEMHPRLSAVTINIGKVGCRQD